MRGIFTILIVLAFSAMNSSAQYTTTGSASTMAGCNDFEITPNSINQVGSVFGNTQIDLTTNFSLLWKVKFGCDNFGGEGMAFVFQPGPWSVGAGSYGLGYQGLTNTLAIEFDTRDNQGSGQIANWDIAGDHVSVMQNGVIDHSSADCLTGLPLDPISTLTGDVEDCAFHLVEFVWTAGATQTIEIRVDGATSLTYTGDMITNSLAGNNMVFYGWTGSTGPIFTNQQTVEVALCPDFTISPTNCPGQIINFTSNVQSQYPITQYDWDFDGTPLINGGPNPSFTYITAGNHPTTLTVTDNQGCTSDTVIDVGVGFLVNVSADDAIVCPGSTTILHAEGVPYTGNSCCFELHAYDLWSDGWGGAEVEVFVDGISVGTYAPPDLGGGSDYTEIFNFCWNIGQTIQLVVNGSLGLQPQESSVFLVDQNNDTIAFIESDFISGGTTWFDGASTTYTVDCGVPPPSYTYQWNNVPLLSSGTSTDPTATVPSGTYFVVDVTDPGTGCTISDSVFVDTYAGGTALISGSQTVCQGANANLTITFTGPTPYDIIVTGPGGPYIVNGITTSPYNFNVSQDGIYSITTFTSAGCPGVITPGTGDLTVIIPPNVDIEANATYCNGDVISALNVVSTNGGTVDWYNNSALNPPIIATGNSYLPTPGVGVTTYYAAESGLILGCQGPADSVVITVFQVPIAPLWLGQTTWCEDDFPTPVTASPELGGSITWYDANPVPGPATTLSTFASYSPTLTVGTFSIWVTETSNGCEGPASEVIYTVKPTPTAPAVAGQLSYCQGDIPTALTATPSLGGQIDWFNTNPTLLGSGTSFIPALNVGQTVINVFETLNGCTSDSTEIIINVDAAPTVDVAAQVSICFGDSISVTAANNGYSITWSLGQSGETVYLGPDSTTLVYVTATNPSCGFATDSILVIVNSLPNVIAGNDTVIGIGGEITLWASSPGSVTYTWVPSVNECVESDCSIIYDVPDQATVYVVFATDSKGCVSTDTVFVDINGYMDVFVPNIFSPNGDGFNDYLVVYGPRLFNYQIEIYDRWGKKIFISDEQKDYWDGKLNGSELSPQTFVYMLSGETVLGQRIVMEGNVSIIK
jgi:gliding motility-associated-like protein